MVINATRPGLFTHDWLLSQTKLAICRQSGRSSAGRAQLLGHLSLNDKVRAAAEHVPLGHLLDEYSAWEIGRLEALCIVLDMVPAAVANDPRIGSLVNDNSVSVWDSLETVLAVANGQPAKGTRAAAILAAVATEAIAGSPAFPLDTVVASADTVPLELDDASPQPEPVLVPNIKDQVVPESICGVDVNPAAVAAAPLEGAPVLADDAKPASPVKDEAVKPPPTPPTSPLTESVPTAPSAVPIAGTVAPCQGDEDAKEVEDAGAASPGTGPLHSLPCFCGGEHAMQECKAACLAGTDVILKVIVRHDENGQPQLCPKGDKNVELCSNFVAGKQCFNFSHYATHLCPRCLESEHSYLACDKYPFAPADASRCLAEPRAACTASEHGEKPTETGEAHTATERAREACSDAAEESTTVVEDAGTAQASSLCTPVPHAVAETVSTSQSSQLLFDGELQQSAVAPSSIGRADDQVGALISNDVDKTIREETSDATGALADVSDACITEVANAQSIDVTTCKRTDEVSESCADTEQKSTVDAEAERIEARRRKKAERKAAKRVELERLEAERLVERERREAQREQAERQAEREIAERKTAARLRRAAEREVAEAEAAKRARAARINEAYQEAVRSRQRLQQAFRGDLRDQPCVCGGDHAMQQCDYTNHAISSKLKVDFCNIMGQQSRLHVKGDPDHLLCNKWVSDCLYVALAD